MEAALDIFDRTEDDEVRLLILQHLFTPSPQWTQRVTRWLGEQHDPREELALVGALADQQQPSVAPQVFGRRMTHYAKTGTPDQWEPFLRLLATWPKTIKTGRVLETMLRRMKELHLDDRPVYLLILRNVAKLTVVDASVKDWDPLREQVLPLTEHSDPRVQSAAVLATAKLEDHRATETFKKRLRTPGGDVRVRRQLINAILVIDGDDSMDFIVEIARKELTAYTVRRLGRVGTPAALPFLEDMKRNSYNSFTRKNAKRSIKQIEKRYPNHEKMSKSPPRPKP